MPGQRVLPLFMCSSLVVLALAAVGVRPMSVWSSVGPKTPGMPSIWAPIGRTPIDDTYLRTRSSMQDLPLQHAPANRPSMQDNSYQQTASNQPLKQFPAPAHTPSNGHPSRQSEGSPRTPHSNVPFNQVSPREPFHCIACKDPSKFRPLHWDSIIYMILDRVTDRMYVGNEFELLNHQCAYVTRPVLMNWSMHIMAKVWCPGWVNLAGTAITDRIPKSIEFATRDFVRKALEAGVVSEEDARPWMSYLS